MDLISMDLEGYEWIRSIMNTNEISMDINTIIFKIIIIHEVISLILLMDSTG